MAPTTPATSTTAAPTMTTSPTSSSASASSRKSPRDDGVYCYLNAVAQHGSGAERTMAESRLMLEQRIMNEELGALEVGDCNCKTRLVERIGSGSFGDVYLGLTQDNTKVAVKVELSTCPRSCKCLLYEGDVYRKLAGCPGIAEVTWFGMHGCDYTMLVMQLLGPTLYSVWTQLGSRFTMKTMLMIVDQTLEIISHVHGRGFVHRDISPSNFMLGPGPTKDQLYLIDFGQSKKPVAKMFVQGSRNRFSFARPLVGTPRFASTFAHAGHDPSYRDDMESLGYLWIYLAAGRLPWQGIKDLTGPAKVERIAQLKMTTPLDQLCAGLPQVFATYMQYARSLRPYDMPDHAAARQMFRALADQLCPNDDDVFDWIGVDLDSDDAAASSSTENNPTSTRRSDDSDEHV